MGWTLLRTAESSLHTFLQAASRGVRTALFRLSMHVYGRNAPGNYIAMQTATAKKDGVARYIGEGQNILFGFSIKPG